MDPKNKKYSTTMQSRFLSTVALILILLTLHHVKANDDGVRGVIVSCPGCTLNRHQELRIFLKEEVEQAYENISIEWIPGEQAVMTIYRGEERVGKVNLYLLQTREEMHNMMKEKGFQRKISSKENEAAPAADETMEISAGKEEIERSLNVEPRAVKESIAFVYDSKIDKKDKDDKKSVVPHHFANLLMSGDLYL